MATAAHEPTTGSSLEESAAARVAARETEPTIGALVNTALQDVSSLVRSEIQLAKTEVMADVKVGGKGAAMFAVAGVFAVFGLSMLLHTIARLIAEWLPVWAGYGIVTLLLFILAGVFAMIGKGAVSRVKGKPERTIATSKETVEVVKKAAQS